MQLTLLVTDIEDSTVTLDRLGDRHWVELVHRHEELVRERAAAHAGAVVKGLGDGFLLRFRHPTSAVRAAVGVQRDLARLSEGAGPLPVRMGIHRGELICDGRDLFGMTIVVASQVSAMARGGQVLVTSAVRHLAAEGQGAGFDRGRDIEVKHLCERVRVHGVRWSGSRS